MYSILSKENIQSFAWFHINSISGKPGHTCTIIIFICKAITIGIFFARMGFYSDPYSLYLDVGIPGSKTTWKIKAGGRFLLLHICSIAVIRGEHNIYIIQILQLARGFWRMISKSIAGVQPGWRDIRFLGRILNCEKNGKGCAPP